MCFLRSACKTHYKVNKKMMKSTLCLYPKFTVCANKMLKNIFDENIVIFILRKHKFLLPLISQGRDNLMEAGC